VNGLVVLELESVAAFGGLKKKGGVGGLGWFRVMFRSFVGRLDLT